MRCARPRRRTCGPRRRVRRRDDDDRAPGLELADQLPDLLGEIAGGAREFEPEPREMRELLRLSFRADDVLVVQFDDDAIDESDEPYSVLRDSGRAAPGRGRGRGRGAGRAARADSAART